MWALTLSVLLTADGGDCARAISKENASALFEALKEMQGEGCTLEEVQTDRGVTRVTWKRDGGELPVMTVEPSACAQTPTFAGPEFAFTAPAQLSEQCPRVGEQLRALLEEDRLGGAVVESVDSDDGGQGASGPQPEASTTQPPTGLGLLRPALAVLIAVAVALRLTLFRKKSGSPGDEQR